MLRLAPIAAFLSLAWFAGPVQAVPMYQASAYCSIADVKGESRYRGTRSKALKEAIERCVAGGGVGGCCAKNARIVSVKTAFEAYARCAGTGADGAAYGWTAQNAADAAVERCVAAGGIRACCRQGVQVGR